MHHYHLLLLKMSKLVLLWHLGRKFLQICLLMRRLSLRLLLHHLFLHHNVLLARLVADKLQLQLLHYLHNQNQGDLVALVILLVNGKRYLLQGRLLSLHLNQMMQRRRRSRTMMSWRRSRLPEFILDNFCHFHLHLVRL